MEWGEVVCCGDGDDVDLGQRFDSVADWLLAGDGCGLNRKFWRDGVPCLAVVAIQQQEGAGGDFDGFGVEARPLVGADVFKPKEAAAGGVRHQ